VIKNRDNFLFKLSVRASCLNCFEGDSLRLLSRTKKRIKLVDNVRLWIFLRTLFFFLESFSFLFFAFYLFLLYFNRNLWLLIIVWSCKLIFFLVRLSNRIIQVLRILVPLSHLIILLSKRDYQIIDMGGVTRTNIDILHEAKCVWCKINKGHVWFLRIFLNFIINHQKKSSIKSSKYKRKIYRRGWRCCFNFKIRWTNTFNKIIR